MTCGNLALIKMLFEQCYHTELLCQAPLAASSAVLLTVLVSLSSAELAELPRTCKILIAQGWHTEQPEPAAGFTPSVGDGRQIQINPLGNANAACPSSQVPEGQTNVNQFVPGVAQWSVGQHPDWPNNFSGNAQACS